MCSVKVFVGLDYHQDQFPVCVLNEAGKVLCNRSLPNWAAAIHQADAGLIRAGKKMGDARRI